MESLGHEVVPFEDVVCQMWDMLKLGDRTYVTLQVGPIRLMYCCRRHLEIPHAPRVALHETTSGCVTNCFRK